MLRYRTLWRGVAGMMAALVAVIGLFESAAAQTALPVYPPSTVATLAFRPGGADTLLLAASDGQQRLQVNIVRLRADGRPVLARSLPGSFAAAAWLDDGHVVTAGDDGKIESWPFEGGASLVLAALPEPILGIGVAPNSHNLAVRLGQTLRLLGADGRPNGPTITLGRPPKPSDTCPPAGIERATTFSPDERLIVFSGLCGDLRITGRDGTRLMHADVPRGAVKRHAFSADGRTLVVTYTGEPTGVGADFWPVAPGRLGNPHPLPDSLPGPLEQDGPADVAALPDRSGFVVLSTDRVRFLAPDGSLLHADIGLAAPGRVAVSADGTRIAVAAAEGLVLFDGNGRRLIGRPFADFGAPVATVPIAGGTQVAALSRDGRVRVWRLDGTETRPPLDVSGAEALPREPSVQKARLLTSPNGRVVGVLAANGLFEVFDESWTRIGRPIRFPTDPDGVAAGATLLLDDRILRPFGDGTGFLALGFDGRVLGRMEFGDREKIVAEAAAASVGLIAIYAADGRLIVWSSDGRPLHQRKIETAGLVDPGLDIAANGKTIVLHGLVGGQPRVLVWRPGEKDTLDSRDGAFAGLLADGSVLRTGKGRLFVDGPDGAVSANLALDIDAVEAVAPDGKLALVIKNGVARTVKIAPDKP